MSLRPLAGLRVVELGSAVSVAFAARLLADLGADVIKLEPPDGDPLRQQGPFLEGDGGQRSSALFAYLNCGKRCELLDPAFAALSAAPARPISCWWRRMRASGSGRWAIPPTPSGRQSLSPRRSDWRGRARAGPGRSTSRSIPAATPITRHARSPIPPRRRPSAVPIARRRCWWASPSPTRRSRPSSLRTIRGPGPSSIARPRTCSPTCSSIPSPTIIAGRSRPAASGRPARA